MSHEEYGRLHVGIILMNLDQEKHMNLPWTPV